MEPLIAAWLARGETTLAVRVTPRASANRLVVTPGPDGAPIVRAFVTAAPEDGKANAAVLKLLAKAIGAPKSALGIARGATGRDKLVVVTR